MMPGLLDRDSGNRFLLIMCGVLLLLLFAPVIWILINT